MRIRILYSKPVSYDAFTVLRVKKGEVLPVASGEGSMPAALASSLVRRGMAEWVESGVA